MSAHEDWRLVTPEAVDVGSDGVRRYQVALAGPAEGVRLPLIVARRGPGPAVLVAGGTHGDEFEGQIATANLARTLQIGDLRGTLLVMPLLNEPACRAGQRRTPGENTDLNRAFGRGPVGTSIAAEIARFVEGLVEGADWVVDLHSGGASLEFVVSSNLQAAVGSPECHNMLPALLAFDAPYAIIFDEERAGPLGMPHAGTLEGFARGLGKRAISSELGGAGRPTPQSLAVAERGLRNLLRHIGVVREPIPTPTVERPGSRLVWLGLPEHHLACPAAGRLAPCVWLGQEVRRGDLLGFVHPAHDPLAQPVPIHAARGGVVVAVPGRGLREEGEAAFFVAEPISASDAQRKGTRRGRRFRAHPTSLRMFPMQGAGADASL